MAITVKEVKYIAKLARIELKPEELNYFTAQLDKIVEYINKLKELDITEASALICLPPAKNVFREDVVRPSLNSEQALSNAVSKEGKYFKVPRIIE